MPQPSADTLDPLAAAARRDPRSEPRKPLVAIASVRLPDGDLLVATTTNLSAHGMDLCCAAGLRPATRCEVSFALPVDGAERPLTLNACVVRNSPAAGGHQLGLVFLGPTARVQELIEYYVFS